MTVRSIKSAERTLALFELFSQREGGLTVGEVATSLEIPQPSSSMLLRNLSQIGYLDYDRSRRRYSPTIRVMLLGSWISRRFSQAGGIAERLEALHARMDGDTVYAAIQNGPALQYVLTLEATLPHRLGVSSGNLRSLTCTAPGRVLLSLKPDREVASWVRRCNAEADEDRLKVREAELLEVMARVRRDGFAETAGQSIPGKGAIAVAIRSPLDGRPLAIGCGSLNARLQERRLELIDELRAIRETYGAPAEPA